MFAGVCGVFAGVIRRVNPSVFVTICSALFFVLQLNAQDCKKAAEKYAEGEALAGKEEYSKALSAFLKAADEQKKCKPMNIEELAKPYTYSGYCAYMLEDYMAARNYYGQAEALYLQSNNLSEISALSYNLGMTFAALGQADSCLFFFNKGAAIDSVAGDVANQAMKIYNVAFIFYNSGLYEQALGLFLRLQPIYDNTSEDAYISFNYSNTAMVYMAMGYYQEAAEYYEKSFLLSEKTDQHQQTSIIAYNLAILSETMMDYEASVSWYLKSIDFERLSGDTTNVLTKHNNIGMLFKDVGKYKEALVYLNLAKAMAERIQSAEDIAVVLNNIGLVYQAFGDMKQAMEYHKRAIEIDREAGLLDDIAIHINNLGLDYQYLGDYDTALEKFEEALQLDTKAGRKERLHIRNSNIGLVFYAKGDFQKALSYFSAALIDANELEDYLKAAVYLNNVGLCYEKSGEFKEAMNSFRKAAEINLSIGNDARYAENLNCLGMVYADMGAYDTAISYYHLAMEINLRDSLIEDIAIVQSNIGTVYKEWGQFENAILNYRESIKYEINSGSKNNLSKKYNNLGVLFYEMEKYDSAITYHNLALELDRLMHKTEDLATDLNNIGMVYYANQDFKLAAKFISEALEIARENGYNDMISTALSNLGLLEMAQDNNDKAVEFFKEALKIDELSGRKPQIAILLNNIAGALFQKEDYPGAIEYYNRAIELFEEIRRTAPVEARREYMEQIAEAYREVLMCYVLENDVPSAFAINERMKAKVLAEQIAGTDTSAAYIRLEDLGQKMQKDEAYILFSSSGKSLITEFLVTPDSAFHLFINKWRVIDTLFKVCSRTLQGQISQQLTERENKIFDGIVANSDVETREEEEVENKLFEAIITYYREQIIDPQVVNDADFRAIGQVLFAIFIGSVDRPMQGIRKLTFVADGILGYLPFETLTCNDGKYLVENFDVSYAQSLTILDLTGKRKYSDTRKPILAMGGAVYHAETYKQDMSAANSIVASTAISGKKRGYLGDINSKQLDYITKLAAEKESTSSEMKDVYEMLGLSSWQNLGGSLAEMREIVAIVPGADTLSGVNLNEAKIKRMSADGKLKDYKVLHFSTHGITVPEIPELSALILSRKSETATVESEDGYLRMTEIANLKIEADFVNLSACETGLGKIYSAEGVVGISQAFLVAGAKGVSVSLWEVADISTVQFMAGLYQKVEKDKISYNAALNAMKREFIAGKFGNELRHPFFWAPFVYYGN